eukprot:9481469-Pyramimonas_sp.AAC.1
MIEKGPCFSSQSGRGAPPKTAPIQRTCNRWASPVAPEGAGVSAAAVLDAALLIPIDLHAGKLTRAL